jgi:hypothetical protein
MQDMTTFTHPIELSDKELDLVAAGTGGGGGCGCDREGGNGNDSINILSFNQVNVGILSKQQNVLV